MCSPRSRGCPVVPVPHVAYDETIGGASSQACSCSFFGTYTNPDPQRSDFVRDTLSDLPVTGCPGMGEEFLV